VNVAYIAYRLVTLPVSVVYGLFQSGYVFRLQYAIRECLFAVWVTFQQVWFRPHGRRNYTEAIFAQSVQVLLYLRRILRVEVTVLVRSAAAGSTLFHDERKTAALA